MSSPSDPEYDLFISHASEDKVGCADPLVRALRLKGLKVWYDDDEILLGDDLRLKMEEGLRVSFLGVVILSPNFKKSWTEAELSSLLAQEALWGRKRILPVLFEIDRKEAAEIWPFIASRASVSFRRGGLVGGVVEKICSAVYRSRAEYRKEATRKGPLLNAAPAAAALDPPEGPSPKFPDERTRDLSSALESLYERRALRNASGEKTGDLDTEIVRIKRDLREGGYLKPGDRLGHRYKLLELLGQGGFAQVWKAFDNERLGLVAVKVLHSQYAADESRRKRFFRGARQMMILSDVEGIVDVLEVEATDGGYFFYVMEYLPDGDFRQAVVGGELSKDDRFRVILDVGRALEVAHRRGIVHRDIKPANILLSSDGHAKLTDFDLVRAPDTPGETKTSKLGTFLYAAPEAMLNAKQANKSADIYGLGMTTLFAMHGSDLPLEATVPHMGFLRDLNLDAELEKVLGRAMERKPGSRWPSVSSFLAALQEAIRQPVEPTEEGRIVGSVELEVDRRLIKSANDQIGGLVEPTEWTIESEEPTLKKTMPAEESSLGTRISKAPTPSLISREPRHPLVGMARSLLIVIVERPWWFWTLALMVSAVMASAVVGGMTGVFSNGIEERGRPVGSSSGLLFPTFVPDHRIAKVSEEILSLTSLGMDFRWIPSDSPAPKQGKEGFWLGETEITQEQWAAVVSGLREDWNSRFGLLASPSHHSFCGADCPVENVSWFEATAFANLLSSLHDLEQCYVFSGGLQYFPPSGGLQDLGSRPAQGTSSTDVGLRHNCSGFRLPSSDEWKRGAGVAFSSGWYKDLGESAWLGHNSFAQYDGASACPTVDLECGPQPVGQKLANEWGLKDILGNVSEICDSRPYAARSRWILQEPVGVGGSWATVAPVAAIANAGLMTGPVLVGREGKSPAVGFRLALSERMDAYLKSSPEAPTPAQ